MPQTEVAREQREWGCRRLGDGCGRIVSMGAAGLARQLRVDRGNWRGLSDEVVKLVEGFA